MMMSMYSAVSGLRSQQTKLNVIGNNIANINTVGYKSQKVGFSDLLSQNIGSASAGSGNRGGMNAKQIGLGTQVSSIEMVMKPGSTQYTGSDTDVALGGEGLFVVQGGGSGKYQYTRAGNFGVDTVGNLVVNGLKVCGYDYNPTTKKYGTDVAALNLFANGKYTLASTTTTKASLQGNLDNSKSTFANPATVTSTLTVYDSQGAAHDTTVTYTNVVTAAVVGPPAVPEKPTNTWNVTVATTGAGWSVASSAATVVFDPTTGKMTTPAAPNVVNLTFTGPTGGATVGTAGVVAVDMSGIYGYTSSTGSSTIKVADSDGYAAGTLQNFAIGADGVITGSYSNGQKQPLGMLSVATFANTAGLEKIGDNLYVPSVNSGAISYQQPGTGQASKLTTGALEMSNVDLANEFSEMMITQRAYQANSKIITTSDTLMETLINMSR